MRTILTMMVICLAWVNAYGQQIRFTDTSNKWTYQVIMPTVPPLTSNHIYDIGTAYKIGNFIYHRVGYTYADYVRYDSVTHKAYAFKLTDTTECLLYDFELKADDTFYRAGSTGKYKHIVSRVDTVIINNEQHRVWTLHNVYSDRPTAGIYPDYHVIEGIGSDHGLDFPLKPYYFEGCENLICFKNKGRIVTIPNPSGGVFADPNTCTVTSVSTVASEDSTIIIIPSPADETSIIRLPYTLSGSISIVNALGQVVIKRELNNVKEVLLGYLDAHGSYFYYIRDKQSNKTFTGKFLYQ